MPNPPLSMESRERNIGHRKCVTCGCDFIPRSHNQQSCSLAHGYIAAGNTRKKRIAMDSGVRSQRPTVIRMELFNAAIKVWEMKRAKPWLQ